MSNDFQEMPAGSSDKPNTYQQIIFQINEESPDGYAISVLFSLSLMSFTYAAPRGYSAEYFIPDGKWTMGYFITLFNTPSACGGVIGFKAWSSCSSVYAFLLICSINKILISRRIMRFARVESYGSIGRRIGLDRNGQIRYVMIG